MVCIAEGQKCLAKWSRKDQLLVRDHSGHIPIFSHLTQTIFSNLLPEKPCNLQEAYNTGFTCPVGCRDKWKSCRNTAKP